MPVTLTVAEFKQLLDFAANATAPVGQTYSFRDAFDRAIKLANQSHPIGALVPEPVVVETVTSDNP